MQNPVHIQAYHDVFDLHQITPFEFGEDAMTNAVTSVVDGKRRDSNGLYRVIYKVNVFVLPDRYGNRNILYLKPGEGLLRKPIKIVIHHDLN